MQNKTNNSWNESSVICSKKIQNTNEANMRYLPLLGILAIVIFTFGILFWWQISTYMDYKKKYGHLFKNDKSNLKGNS